MKELVMSNQNKEQIEREAQILKELDHPNIVAFYEFHKEGYEAFLVMELAQQSLHDFLKSTIYPVPLVVVG
jgi:serine/threonine protein kinase